MGVQNYPQQMPVAYSARFVESEEAGPYTFDVFVPAGAMLIDAIVHGEVLWNDGTAASMEVGWYADSSGSVGNAIDADALFTAVNLKATDLTAGQSISLAHPGGVQGAEVDLIEQDEGASPPDGDVHVENRVDAADRWLRFKVAVTDGDGDAGVTYVCAIIAQAPSKVIAA